MNVWELIEKVLGDARRLTFDALMDAVAAARSRREEAAFSIALIALSAKMARADGVVTDDEIDAFRSFFEFPPSEAGRVRMVYQLAQQDVAGFGHYLTRVGRLFEDDETVLTDVLDCLYHIALADGIAHPREMALLDEAAAIFRLSPAGVRRVKAAHLGLGADDPYAILGLDPGADAGAVKTRYRDLVREHHPDALIARGVPASLIKIAEGRTAAINTAYEKIANERTLMR